MSTLRVAVLAALINLLVACSLYAQQADVIFHNGSILTMAGAKPRYVEALVVSGGKIVFAGAKDEAWQRQGKATRMVDLAGKALLPGFLDGHSHYINSLLVANQCKLYAPPAGPGRDVPSILAELKSFADKRRIPAGELIMAYGYDDTVMPDGRLLNRDDLDAAFPNHPVRVDHVSMHGCVLNTLALKKYGITAATPTPPGGIIVRKPGTAEPWGLIMETAFLPIFEQTEPLTAQQEIDGSRAGQMLYAEAGITTAHEGATHLPQLQSMQRATEAGANLIDIVAFPFITDLERVLDKIPVDRWGKYDRRFKIGGVKITLDGSPQGRTAYFTTAYRTGGPGGEQNWKGEPTFPEDLALQSFKKVHDLRVPLIVHCNGDAAIDLFLKGYEFARRGDDGRPWNVTTIHTQFLRKDQIPKFVEYKVRPSFYTLHTYYFAEAHQANRGPEQTAYLSPLRDAIDAGLRPTNHTDFVVAPLDQMFMLWSAVNRVSRGGEVIGADQRVSVYEGLKTMTEWAAEQYGEQATKGTLEVGKLADLVILDKNPLQVEPLAIKEIKVVETLKEGRTIYPTSADLPAPKAAADPGRTYSWKSHVCDMADVNRAAGKEWTLVALEGKPVNVERPPTMKFAAGKMSVFGGVNRLFGSYALVHDRVVIGRIASTKIAGPRELMQLETNFAKVLSTVNRFHVHGQELELLVDDRVVAEFRIAK